MAVLQNPRHEAFAQGLAKGQTADQAYEAAGYKPNRGNAVRMKTNDSIASRIEEIVSAGAVRAEIDVARTLKELVRIGTSDVRKLFNSDGHLLSIHDLDDDTAAAVSSVEVVGKPGLPNEDGTREIEYTHKIKMWDKNSALDKIGKHLAMFTEKHEHSGPNGGPIQTEEVANHAAAFASRMAGLAARSIPDAGTGEADD